MKPKPELKYVIGDSVEIWIHYRREYHYWRMREDWYNKENMPLDILADLNQARAEKFLEVENVS